MFSVIFARKCLKHFLVSCFANIAIKSFRQIFVKDCNPEHIKSLLCSMSKFKRKVQGFITIRSIFCQIAGICMVKKLNGCYLFTFPFFVLHGKEWRQPISRWVLPLCSECICKVLCWWLSWAGLQIGRNFVSTDAPNVEDSSACCKGLKLNAEMLNTITCMHLCKYAKILVCQVGCMP